MAAFFYYSDFVFSARVIYAWTNATNTKWIVVMNILHKINELIFFAAFFHSPVYCELVVAAAKNNTRAEYKLNKVHI